MRVQAPNGRFYDPEKSAVIGERVTPDGKIQRLQRSVVGAYFFFETPSKSMRSAVTPTTYDEALEWAKKYIDENSLTDKMTYSNNNVYHLTTTLKRVDYSRLEMIAKRECLSLKDSLNLIARQYAERGETK